MDGWMDGWMDRFNSSQFNSRSYLLKVEHDMLTEHFFSHGPQKKRIKRDNKR